MRKGIKLTIHLFLLLLFVTSCSNKFSLQKRKYNKGFYFSAVKKHDVKKQDVAVKDKAENKPETVIEESAFVKTSADKTAVAIVADETQKETFGKESLNSPKSKQSKVEDVSVNNPRDKEVSQAEIKNGEFEQEENASESKGATSSLNKKGGGLLEAIADIYIGYYIICIVIAICYLLWILFETYSVTQALGIIAVVVLVLAACYAVGSFFTGF